MDWLQAEDPQASSFSYMDFNFEGDPFFDFGPADDASQFESATFDPTNTSFSDAYFPASQHIDPTLVSPQSDAEVQALARNGPVGDAGAKLAQQARRQQLRSQRRKAPDPRYLPPGLSTEFSEGSMLVYGQITPPNSDTASPPQPALDTIDPSAVMPMHDSTPKLDADTLDLASGPRMFPPIDTASSSSSKPAVADAKPKDAAAAAAAATADAPVKPKSKRGRKKKILAPAAREAQRARTLARNRAAAQRCRQRKKTEHAALETKARTLTKERARLTVMVGSLRDELLSLKGAMLSHAGCAEIDGNVARYVREQREMLMAGMPGDAERADATASKKLLADLGLKEESDAEEDQDDDHEEDEEEENEENEEDEEEDPDGEGDSEDEDDAVQQPPRKSAKLDAAIARRTRSRGQRRT